MDVNSTEVTQAKETVAVRAERLTKEVEPVQLTLSRRKDISAEYPAIEQRRMRTMAGQLGYIWVAACPLASFEASYIQKAIPRIKKTGIKEANGMEKDVTRHEMQLMYLRPSKEELYQARLVVFRYTCYLHKYVYKNVEQEWSIIGVAYGSKRGCIFNTPSWLPKKQHRVSNSTIQAVKIAVVRIVGCLLYAQAVWEYITGMKLPVTVVTDSMPLHKTMATQATGINLMCAADKDSLCMDYETYYFDIVT